MWKLNFDVWKEYAYQVGIHPAVLSYLELRKENFYRMETTVDGKAFVTARGWEDLSRLIQVMKSLVKRWIVRLCISTSSTGRQRRILQIIWSFTESIRRSMDWSGSLQDIMKKDTLERLKFASFDERLSVVNLLVGKMAELFKEEYEMEKFVEGLFAQLCAYKEELQKEGAVSGRGPCCENSVS